MGDEQNINRQNFHEFSFSMLVLLTCSVTQDTLVIVCVPQTQAVTAIAHVEIDIRTIYYTTTIQSARGNLVYVEIDIRTIYYTSTIGSARGNLVYVEIDCRTIYYTTITQTTRGNLVYVEIDIRTIYYTSTIQNARGNLVYVEIDRTIYYASTTQTTRGKLRIWEETCTSGKLRFFLINYIVAK